jgi:hypothetical protein
MIDGSSESKSHEVATGAAKAPPPGKDPTPLVDAPLKGYAFTLRASLTQTFIGEIPSGFRIDLQYDPDGTVVYQWKTDLQDAQAELKGAQLLTGTDWVSINNDGLATFDTRITLRVGQKAKDPDKRCVISANIRGRVDLATAFQGAPGAKKLVVEQREQILPRWKKGFPTGTYLPLALSVIFDVPIEGSDDSQNKIYERCRELERGLFVAYGRATYIEGPNSPLDSIYLHVFKVQLPENVLSAQPREDEAPDHAVENDNSSAQTMGSPT